MEQVAKVAPIAGAARYPNIAKYPLKTKLADLIIRWGPDAKHAKLSSATQVSIGARGRSPRWLRYTPSLSLSLAARDGRPRYSKAGIGYWTGGSHVLGFIKEIILNKMRQLGGNLAPFLR